MTEVFIDQDRFYKPRVLGNGRITRRELFKNECLECGKVDLISKKRDYCNECRLQIKKSKRIESLLHVHYTTETGEQEVALFTKSKKQFFVSQCDLDSILRFNWTLDKDGYVTTSIKIEDTTKQIKMHRFLLNAKDGSIIDHINRNTSDNTRKNLRFCTRSENAMNKRIKDPELLKSYKGKPCEICKNRGSVVAHHIRTKAAGGHDVVENLVGLCFVHHREIHDYPLNRFCKENPHMNYILIKKGWKLDGYINKWYRSEI